MIVIPATVTGAGKRSTGGITIRAAHAARVTADVAAAHITSRKGPMITAMTKAMPGAATTT